MSIITIIISNSVESIMDEWQIGFGDFSKRSVCLEISTGYDVRLIFFRLSFTEVEQISNRDP